MPAHIGLRQERRSSWSQLQEAAKLCWRHLHATRKERENELAVGGSRADVRECGVVVPAVGYLLLGFVGAYALQRLFYCIRKLDC